MTVNELDLYIDNLFGYDVMFTLLESSFLLRHEDLLS